MAIEPAIHTEGVRAEIRDANMPGIVILGAAIVVTVAVVMLFCWWLFGIYGYVHGFGPAATPYATARPLPPEPRLQPKPENDLRQYFSDESSELDSYGWVDRANGVVRIPIDRAMKLLLQRGLPVRNAEQPRGAEASRAQGMRRGSATASAARRDPAAGSAMGQSQVQRRERQ